MFHGNPGLWRFPFSSPKWLIGIGIIMREAGLIDGLTFLGCQGGGPSDVLAMLEELRDVSVYQFYSGNAWRAVTIIFDPVAIHQVLRDGIVRAAAVSLPVLLAADGLAGEGCSVRVLP